MIRPQAWIFAELDGYNYPFERNRSATVTSPRKTKPAVLTLLVVCVLLALLLILHRIPPMAAGLVFAAMLAVTGIASAGFRR